MLEIGLPGGLCCPLPVVQRHGSERTAGMQVTGLIVVPLLILFSQKLGWLLIYLLANSHSRDLWTFLSRPESSSCFISVFLCPPYSLLSVSEQVC
jgi:hypothetical protein